MIGGGGGGGDGHDRWGMAIIGGYILGGQFLLNDSAVRLSARSSDI